jgi:hypothetical protein
MRQTLWGIALLVFGILVGILVGRFVPNALHSNPITNEKRLEAKLGKVDFQNVPLSQVVDRLNRDHHANVGVNWRVLEACGIDENTPVFVQTQGLPLKRVLDLVCKEVGQDTVMMGYRADDDVILITTAEELSRETVVHVYDVRDLVTYDHDLREGMHRLFDPRNWSTQGKAEPEKENPAIDSVQSLVQVITETIEPDSWRDAGGTTGSINEFGGRLIIIQTAQTHQRIAALLDKLERGT